MKSASAKAYFTSSCTLAGGRFREGIVVASAQEVLRESWAVGESRAHLFHVSWRGRLSHSLPGPLTSFPASK